MEERERIEVAAAAALSTKAEDVLLFDMESRSAITDFVLICSGRSQAHVRGICERIQEDMRNVGYRCQSVEGMQEGSWVLLDYDILLVHVFHPETRAYYDLEGLFATYPREQMDSRDPDPAPDDDRASSAA